MTGWRKLGIIAGGGELPVVLAEHMAATQRPYFVARVAQMADPALANHPGAEHGLGAMGARMDAMREAGCDAVVLLGQVARPDLKTLQLDDVADFQLALRAGLARYFEFYNARRRHSALDRRTPDAVYFELAATKLAA